MYLQSFSSGICYLANVPNYYGEHSPVLRFWAVLKWSLSPLSYFKVSLYSRNYPSSLTIHFFYLVSSSLFSLIILKRTIFFSIKSASGISLMSIICIFFFNLSDPKARLVVFLRSSYLPNFRVVFLFILRYLFFLRYRFFCILIPVFHEHLPFGQIFNIQKLPLLSFQAFPRI